MAMNFKLKNLKRNFESNTNSETLRYVVKIGQNAWQPFRRFCYQTHQMHRVISYKENTLRNGSFYDQPSNT